MANEHINWYPGHMKKSREMIQENLKLTNAAIEILDARIPAASANPILGQLLQGKPKIVILNKSDLADPEGNQAWVKGLRQQGAEPVCMNALTGEGMTELYRAMNRIHQRINENQTRKKPLRAMIVGIPNVGKSSLINRLAGKKSAKTGNKPGVTRGKQWISLEPSVQVLDTPGILWPKFEDQNTALMLSYIGSIRDEILDREELALSLLDFLQKNAPGLLEERYRIQTEGREPLSLLEEICQKRGFLLSGGRFDYARGARTLTDEFRSGKMGRVTLQWPEGQKGGPACEK